MYLKSLDDLHWYSDQDDGLGVYYSESLDVILIIDVETLEVTQIQRINETEEC